MHLMNYEGNRKRRTKTKPGNENRNSNNFFQSDCPSQNPEVKICIYTTKPRPRATAHRTRKSQKIFAPLSNAERSRNPNAKCHAHVLNADNRSRSRMPSITKIRQCRETRHQALVGMVKYIYNLFRPNVPM
jgi:hypothetical protein